MTQSPFFWAILTAIVWGIVPILEKAGLSNINFLNGLFIRCLGVIFGAFLLILFRCRNLRAELSSVNFSTIILLLAAGFLASFVGQLFFYRALKFGQVSRVVPLAATYPLVSFLLALIFLGEKIILSKIFGVCLVILGVIFLK